MQLISHEKTVRSNTVQGLKDFKSQTSATKGRKGEQLVSLKPTIKKAFVLMGVDIVEISAKNKTLKNKIGIYDGKWSEESRTKLSKQLDADSFFCQNGKTMEKQLNIGMYK